MKKTLIALMMMGLSTGVMADDTEILRTLKSIEKELQIQNGTYIRPSVPISEEQKKKNLENLCRYWEAVIADPNGYIEKKYINNPAFWEEQRNQYRHMIGWNGIDQDYIDNTIIKRRIEISTNLIMRNLTLYKKRYEKKCI